MSDEKVAIAYCPTCKEKNPVQIQDMAKGKGKNKITATMIWCVVCEYVLNIDKKTNIEWVTEKWLNEHGWTADKPQKVNEK